MMKKEALLIFFMIVTITLQTQYVPIPKTTVGVPFGNANGKISFELIYDPVCFTTSDFDVKVIRALQSQLPKETLDQISFRIVGEAKPWHLTAHKIIQGINYVLDTKGAAEALKCYRYFLDNVSAWDNTILQTKTIAQFMDLLAGQFQKLTGVNKAAILPQLAHYSNYDAKARYQFKHTTGSRYSGLNPTIFVNGARVDNGQNIPLDGWKKLINDLLK